MNEHQTIIHIQKAQWLRAVDVVVLGPAMMYAGYKYNMPLLAKLFFMAGGAMTIGYNLNNWVMQDRWAREYRKVA